MPDHWRTWLGTLTFGILEQANLVWLVQRPSATPDVLDHEAGDGRIIMHRVQRFLYDVARHGLGMGEPIGLPLHARELLERDAAYGTPTFQNALVNSAIPVSISADPNDPEVQAIAALGRPIRSSDGTIDVYPDHPTDARSLRHQDDAALPQHHGRGTAEDADRCGSAAGN